MFTSGTSGCITFDDTPEEISEQIHRDARAAIANYLGIQEEELTQVRTCVAEPFTRPDFINIGD